ncbi:MAG: ABC transporter permease [Actinomycetia bacterium]|nr:ABC transporter permease [Actinomycetes bacterium]
MGRYAARRGLQFVPVFFGTTFLVYFLMFALPGDPLANLSVGKQANPAYLAYLQEQFNLDDPFFVQYLKYLGGIFTGDLGQTFRGQSVAEIFVERFPVTLKLALTAFVFEALLGVGIGVWAALRKGRFIDNLSLAGSLILISIPVFVLGYVAQWLFGVKLGWFPVAGISAGWPMAYILPAIVLAALSLAYVLRLTRQSLLETLNSDFIRTARAKGLPPWTILRKYGLRNSLIPVVTFLGADLAALMGGAVVIEGIFNVPGIGQQLYSSIRLGEAVVVVGLVTALVIIYLLVNLLVDLLYGVLDPRIRYE